MKTLILFVVFLVASRAVGFAQTSGNIAYSQSSGKARAEQNERAKRVPDAGQMPLGSNSMFLEASVLINLNADEYVAVFGFSQEGTTVPECNQKMDAAIEEFSGALKSLGVGSNDLFVDFAAQNKVYGYKIEGNVAREELVGFELKKNIAIHYREKLLLDKLVLAAANSKIFDLIKVDYIVKDTLPVQNRLMEEAARILKLKAARYETLLGIKLLASPQVYAEKPSVYFPTQMYDSYAAYETETINAEVDRSRHIIQGARKSRTFFFNALSADGFDYVVNPVVVEPVVQFTLYLKVKYDLDPRRPRKEK